MNKPSAMASAVSSITSFSSTAGFAAVFRGCLFALFGFSTPEMTSLCFFERMWFSYELTVLKDLLHGLQKFASWEDAFPCS